ncbi:hypothetical protein BC962_2255 [Gillisia mitskevichiae]|uniref:Uncharacterized protein n=1 Tax=Gillisia mitskevichiae TaxID=270921 RepID=A0A495PIH6_9FLAO|nr:hypothetical protein BC962_2255 [Gillisia mitskevichiae]
MVMESQKMEIELIDTHYRLRLSLHYRKLNFLAVFWHLDDLRNNAFHFYLTFFISYSIHIKH